LGAEVALDDSNVLEVPFANWHQVVLVSGGRSVRSIGSRDQIVKIQQEHSAPERVNHSG
jgi:hypothetical protein